MRLGGREDEQEPVARADLDAVVAHQLMLQHALAVHVGAVLGAQVDEEVRALLEHDLGVGARDAGIGQHEVVVGLASDAEGAVVEHQRALVGAVQQHHHRLQVGGGGGGWRRNADWSGRGHWVFFSLGGGRAYPAMAADCNSGVGAVAP